MAERQYHLSFLDGLRGFAAYWVVIGHAMYLSGWKWGIFAGPDLAVELFIIISGFLMTWHYQAREQREPWDQTSTWKIFWTRRFFRIAPLYYVALAAALLMGPMLWEDRLAIGAAIGTPVSENNLYIHRYLDASPLNIFLHVTFLFGMTWTHNFRTALPDWSIGLEMQYYAVFPLIMLLLKRRGFAAGMAALVGVMAVAGYFLEKNGFVRGAYSILAMKFHLFAAGMTIAASMRAKPEHLVYYWWLACAFIFVPLGGVRTDLDRILKILIVSGFFLLLYRDRFITPLKLLADGLDRLLSNRVANWVGELSYGIYLVHLLLMLPIGGYLARNAPDLAPFTRFAATLGLTTIATLVIGWLAYRFIEQPGIALGRKVADRFRKR